MNPSKRIFINTIAQYTKSFINVCLSLCTVRLILSVLGENDYGIYMLVAGVVSMLGFVANAMVITTQRYLSYNYGLGDTLTTRKVFSNSLILHIIMGCVIMVVLCLLKGLILTPDVLVIEANRWPVVDTVYFTTVSMLVLTFLTAPFKAIFIARENIVFISVIEVVDGVLKLGLALILVDFAIDKLLIYSIMMSVIFTFEFAVYSVYAITKFQECCPSRLFVDFDRHTASNLMGFAGWTTCGMGIVIARNQGLAVLLNQVFGTVINSAYGVANQLYSNVAFIGTSIQNAINPQIMRACGEGDRLRMFSLAAKESKFVVMIMSLFFIPLCVEMDSVLDVWLGADNVPAHTALFCRSLLVVFLCDQLTYGLNAVVQAIGKLALYTVIMYVPKALLLIVFYMMLREGFGVEYVMGVYIAVELLVALCRLIFVSVREGLSLVQYCRSVIAPLIPLLLLLVGTSVLVSWSVESSYGFVVTICVSGIVGLVWSWMFVMSDSERKSVVSIIRRRM